MILFTASKQYSCVEDTGRMFCSTPPPNDVFLGRTRCRYRSSLISEDLSSAPLGSVDCVKIKTNHSTLSDNSASAGDDE